MKVRLPVMIKDFEHARFYDLPLTENWDVEGEDFFLDGPVTKRVAVVDFDPDTGLLAAPVKFNPPAKGKKLGRYDVPEKITSLEELLDPKSISVCVFSAVLRTIRMFEGSDVLGRKLTWGFAGPQLLIVPRAGRWENAYYERDSRSLQFFYFPMAQKEASKRGKKQDIESEKLFYTSLSNDIVTHETGHAILDGIAPDLYDAITPQSLAIHEAVADLVAVVMAFRSKQLSQKTLDRNSGSIADSNEFSGLAKGFEEALRPLADEHFLRNLRNELTLEDVRSDEPHSLSQVLSGALYAVIYGLHERWKDTFSKKDESQRFSMSGKALAVAVNQFKRQIFRALDYLPPGDVSFADYARAIVAADQAIYPKDSQERQEIVAEFVKRKIVRQASDLNVKTNYSHSAVQKLNLETLVESDWAAYEFANNNRSFLGIPSGVQFRVRARLKTTKVDPAAGSGSTQSTETNGNRSECLFKVSWTHQEANKVPGLPPKRQLTVGTTLAIDWETKIVRALLTSDYQSKEQSENRDAILCRMVDEGALAVGDQALGPDGKVLGTTVQAHVIDGLMRMRGMARTLHICKESR